ncbi:aminodeoxychorismate synthase component I [Legionella maioricensis]|uniref:aminodeoxychorismate synthase n=1 Tax=Legionella maioricensis TaxID=2896528 RepID=A0A9X2D2C9_9GAMM|nr:aminodeoxychorismate synthase component I [Legionella maioricensis]MCL9685034.1 aminodeoxychorismate synthase component I [Legionella maioricensis]MCL9688069.1 aminodeoxychorismate synthase component I [Legionella maioricensis]
MNNKESVLLAYHPFLQESYQKLSHLPGFVLLESRDCMRGRYDILSAYPHERIVITENTPNKSSVFEHLKKKLSLQPSENDLPFQGGAIGYISYDLGARLLGINSSAQLTLQDMPLLDLGLYDWAIIVDHYLKKVVLFAANNHLSTSDITREVIELWHAPPTGNNRFAVKTGFIPLISKDAYRESFLAIHQSLKEGRSYQVNLTQPFHAEYEGDAWEMYKKICSKNPVPFSAFLKTKEADILSFSPERFLLYDQGELLTSPIKGTIGRSNNPVEDEQLKNQLTLCDKNRAENVMIVDLLRNDLGKISVPGTVQVSNLCGIQSYNSLHHLVSDIKAQCLDALHPFDAFISCFPGGSITGAPKLESMKIINEQERYGRGIYCGSIGYFSQHGRFDTNIAIRTVTAKDNILHLAAGGGIVIDSNCEDEYRECYTKIAAIINGLK